MVAIGDLEIKVSVALAPDVATDALTRIRDCAAGANWHADTALDKRLERIRVMAESALDLARCTRAE